MSHASVEPVTVLPEDAYNQALVEQVHPPNWENPQPAASYNLVVIGGGTAGLVAAAGAAGLGAKVALVEKHLMGGDCLNVGCVPSKCMIRSARVVADLKAAEQYGIHVPEDVEVNFSGVMERLRRLRAEISPHDSAQRFQELGVDVFLGAAKFADANSIEVAGQTLRFKQAVIATGTRPIEPAIPGLAEAGYLTNENVFSLTQRPQRLAVVGGGPIGCELAQTFRRLGSEVVLFHKHSHLLDREDESASEIIQRTFIAEGVQLVLSAQVQRVEAADGGKVIHYESEGQAGSLMVDEILVGAGRVPNVEGLELERVGVKYDQHQGVWVNDHLQTTNSRIYAAGDICMDWKFTHAADAAARIVIQNALFLGRKKLSSLTMPWVTYTDPEIAHVGLYEQQAQAQGIKLDTYLVPLEEVDRAIADGETAGFAKIHVKHGSDKIVGATIVARHAGEMISEVTLAMVGNLGLKAIATTIHPYPTQAEVIRKVADAYNRTRLTPTVKKLFSTWLAWRR
ncbi:MAG: mercuric reductase [Trichocoleus desertorum ATA4-8-CV12]|jgi:mercury(II) reductase|nr:mercuric reductase [Trichocoleus desertorum ATA4-8-CV12]